MIFLLFDSSCAKLDVHRKASLPERPILFEQSLFSVLNGLESKELNVQNLVSRYYKTTNNSLVWNVRDTSSKAIEELINLSNEINLFGVTSLKTELTKIQNLYQVVKQKTIAKETPYKECAELDALLTKHFIDLARKLKFGDYYLAFSGDKVAFEEFNPTEKLSEALQTSNIRITLLSFQPKSVEYLNLQKAYAKWRSNVVISEVSYQVSSEDEKDRMARRNTVKSLRIHGYLNHTPSCSRNDYKVALKQFKADHGLEVNLELDEYTAKALSKSTNFYDRQARLSLQKWKLEGDWGDYYISANIPQFEVKVIKDDSTNLKLKSIIGRMSSQTPELHDSLEQIIAYPFWNVTANIARNEFLPKLKKDPTYLQRRNYQIYTRNGRKMVDAKSVNWKNISSKTFRYRIRQRGGRSNAMGVIKFVFPNRHNIYFHDTPRKSLFANNRRAYSHGCLRLENPLELARVLSENDGIDFILLSEAIANRRRKKIELNKFVGVHTHYKTASTKSDTTIIFLEDIYLKDDDFYNLMEIKDSDGNMDPNMFL